MISNENFKVKVKKRQVNTPGFFGNKKAHIFKGQDNNNRINRPHSKNLIKGKNINMILHFPSNGNKNQINLFNNIINNKNPHLELIKNKKKLKLANNLFSEEKNMNNKRIYLGNNHINNSNGFKDIIQNHNIIKINGLSKSMNKKKNNEINLNIKPNVLNNKMKENNLKKNQIILQNNINLINIKENKDINLIDIFPKIKKNQKINKNLQQEEKNIHDFNKIYILKNKIVFPKNENPIQKRKIVIVPQKNSEEKKVNNINIINNKPNKNVRYILKNSNIKKEEPKIINFNKNVFKINNNINSRQNKFLFKMNINNNIKNEKSSDYFNYKLKQKNNNFLINKNILKEPKDINKNIVNKFHSLSEEKSSNNDLNIPEKIINLKDYYCIEEKNSKTQETMEDFTLIKHPFLSIEKHNLSLFSIFDGHGGDYVAKYLKENFDNFLQKSINNNCSLNFSNIIKATFESLDKNLEKFSQAEECGSTGTVVIINNNSVYCANVGDSKCFYINKSKAIQLTEDHNCKNLKEKEELKNKGIIIFRDRVYGTLSLTRSFGDTQLKKEGITCEPYIKKIFLDKNDVHYIVIASDGIWDAVSGDKLFEIYKELKNNTSEEFCTKLVDYALNNGSTDNISCIVLRF